MQTTWPFPFFPPPCAGLPARLLAIGLILVATGSSTRAGDIFVDDDGTSGAGGTSFTDAISDLQQALSLAASGDRIFVAVGNYTPHPVDSSQSFFLKDGVAIYGGFDGTESTLAQRAGKFEQTVLWKSLVPVPQAIVVSGLVAGPGGALDISVKGKSGPPIAVYVQCIAVGGATGAMVRLSNALAVGVGA